MDGERSKTPYIAIIVLGALGIAFTVLPYALPVNLLPVNDNIKAVIAGGGLSFITSAFVNWIWNRTTKKQINRMEDEIKKTTDATLEILGVQNNIRRNQVIDIELSKMNGSVFAKVIHTFDYSEERKAEQVYTLKIFSDFRGEILSPDAVFNRDAAPDFYFELVEEDNIPIADWSKIDDREKLYNVRFGKLCYSQSVTLPPKGKDKRFKFVIRNKYRKHDKLVWTFQEMSYPRVVIKLKIQPSCIGMNFYLRINHPRVDEFIEEHLKKPEYMNDIEIETGKVKVPKLTFTMNKNVLPYQGFEVSWDSPDDNNPLEPLPSTSSNSDVVAQ